MMFFFFRGLVPFKRVYPELAAALPALRLVRRSFRENESFSEGGSAAEGVVEWVEGFDIFLSFFSFFL
jgi:hypothetical protein